MLKLVGKTLMRSKIFIHLVQKQKPKPNHEEGFPGGSVVKNLLANAGDVGYPWVRKISSWRRKWQPPQVFFPGKSHRQRNLAGYSPWGCKSWT